MSMRRRHPTTANDRSNNCRHLNLSASIPLPPSHIHRTPSELQLADDILRAEYEDVRMCVRLVSGMRSKCLVSGYVHPRTMQSVQDILKTKRANENQLGLVENNNHHHHHHPQLPEHAEEDEADEEEDQDWGLAYEDVDEEDDSASGTPTPCHPYAMMSPFSIKSPSSSDGSALSLQQLHQSSNDRGREDDPPPEDDECVFSLEL